MDKKQENTILEQAAEILKNRYLVEKQRFSNEKDIGKFLGLYFSTHEREIFSVMFLDTQLHLIAIEDMFQGTINSASVYPREVVKRALELNAANIVIAHNHPSGNPEPSQADRRITTKISDALSYLDIPLLDHFVIGGEGYVSFANRGWI